jgi:hypothetical protein
LKVYLATSGEYSDFRVVHVFARKEDAASYPLADDHEEYEVAEGPIEVRHWHRLAWWPDLPDSGSDAEYPNPATWSQSRDFDGHPNHVEHAWKEPAGRAGRRSLVIEGWDLERIRKVYSEQRAQYTARQDLGTV